jgi:MFS family permease
MYFSPNAEQALRWARIGFIGIIFIPITAFHFSSVFSELLIGKRILILLYALSIPSLFISQSNLIYSGISKYFWGYYPVAGKLYFIFLLMFFVLFGLCLFILLKGYKKAQKNKDYLRTQQFKYMFLAFAFGTTGIVDYIIKYQITFYPFGYISALLFITLIAFAVLKHRLMDINIVIRKTLVYTVLAGLFSGAYLTVLFLLAAVFQNIFGLGSLLIMAAFLFASALALQPLKARVQETIDKYFFKTSYEYQKAIKELSHIPTTLITSDKLFSTFNHSIIELLKPERIAFYLLNKNENRYQFRSGG